VSAGVTRISSTAKVSTINGIATVSEESTHSAAKEPRVVAAVREYFDQLDRGMTVDREAFLARNPTIAPGLRSAIAEEEARRRRAAESPAAVELTGGSTGAFTRHGDTLPPPSRSDLPATASSLPVGTQLGRYRIVRVLGRGAMGTVYLAIDTQLDRQVALKTPQFDQDSDLLQRFHREARAAAALRHANICPIYDFGQIEEKHFISMAYIEGQTLAALIETGEQQPVKRVLTIALKIAQALQEAHDHGIVHRDLKPSNVMLDKRGEPIVMDFGLARQIAAPDNVRLTQSGILVGTPAFMSPEQIEGDLEKVGPASDQYSLGVLLYELFTQQLPFRGSSMAIIAQALVKEPPPPIQFRTDLDPRINTACLKMMAKAPEDRFASCGAVADELEAILEDRQSRPASSPAPAAPSASVSAERTAAKERRQSLAAQFLAKRPLSEQELVEVEKSARRQFDLHQFEKVVEIIGQARDDQLPARLQGLLSDARGKCAEIATLLMAIDEASRSGDRTTALQRVEALLRIQPRNPRACEMKAQLEVKPRAPDTEWTKRRTLWAALVAVVLVGLLILAAMMGRRSDEPDTSQPSISSPPAPPQTPSPDDAQRKGGGK
jgi:serine/threonine protein kinase